MNFEQSILKQRNGVDLSRTKKMSGFPVSLSQSSKSNSRRIAISGIGMVTPCGPDRESSWEGLVSGISRLRWLTTEEHREIGCDPGRTRLAGAPAILERDREPNTQRAVFHPCSAFETSPLDRMLFQAAAEASIDALLPVQPQNADATVTDRHRIGLVIGTSKASLGALGEFHRTVHLNRKQNHTGESSVGLSHQNGNWLACWPSSPASRLAAAWDIRGPVLAPVAACATGMASICRGVELIRDGVCDTVFAGSVDDSLSEMIWASYRRLGVLSRIQNDDPSIACRPFDRDRSGFLMGAGAAVIVLENWETAISRGRVPYAEWLGGGTLSDATALTQVSVDAAGLTRLIQDILRRSGISAGELDYINLHGTGTRENDRYETQGIRQALRNFADGVSCSSLKGTMGHLLGGAGSVEFAATVLALRDGIVPPTCHLEHPSPECDLDYTPQVARHKRLQIALKLSLGFGGHLVGGLIRRTYP